MTRLHGTFLPLVMMWILLLSTEASGAQTLDSSALEGYIEDEMAHARIPGLALTIVQGDRIAYQRGFGSSGPDGRPVTPQTPFITSSAGSKAFTALAVMQLAEAGKIDLNAPIQTYLPWVNLRDAAAARISVRNLLNHTSGFSVTDGRRFPSSHAGFSIDEEVGLYRALKLDRPVGGAFEYSNVNYNMLGLLVEKVSGRPYADYIREHIFVPLGMMNSCASRREAPADAMAVGYRQWFGFPVTASGIPILEGMFPSAYCIASSEDLGHFLIAHLNQGRHLGGQVVSSRGMAELQKPAVKAVHYGVDGYYAMGCHVMMLDGMECVWFPGDLANMRTTMLIVPAKRLGVVVQMNVNGGLIDGRLTALAPNVARLLMGHPTVKVGDNGMLLRMIFSVIVLALQVFGLIWFLLVFRRWRRLPESVPQTLWKSLLIVGLPLVLDLALCGAVLFGIPRLFQVPLPTLRLFWPDLSVLLYGIVALALCSALLRIATGTWLVSRLTSGLEV